ncbi:MAG: DUF5060 domain-containing protein, partial [Verrucomicrobiota bacterium]
QYAAHIKDWQAGDPLWKDGRGKGMIGGINYLASVGVNALYFLTLNLEGDGRDVWPYRDPADFTRFDCSKLDQWEMVFSHLQAKGILLHIVTQETENETLLDGGDTGPLRQLYYLELISRFGHHLGLVWNLGEENGPADFSPVGQTTAQRKAMASFFKDRDPYQHPVVLHTHSTAHHKKTILTDLLGFEDLDGLSFQVDQRERVHQEIRFWREEAVKAGHEWSIGMDEIGMWHTGALPDSVDPEHHSLRRHALWGSLLGGAAGVEWYFGARHPHNDLTAEDWRSRAHLWDQTRHAWTFFTEHLPWWRMKPGTDHPGEGYCLGIEGELYAIYATADERPVTMDLPATKGGRVFELRWYDPLKGGELQIGSEAIMPGFGVRGLGEPPHSPEQDWVILLR